MAITLTAAQLVAVMEATVAGFLAVLLFASHREGAKWLGGFVAVLAAAFFLSVAPAFDLPSMAAIYINWLYWLQLLAMPFLYRYTCLIVGKQERYSALHFGPAAFFALLTLPFAEGVDAASILLWATVAQAFIYLPVTMYLLRGRRLALKQNFSSLMGLELRWLEKLCLWLLLLIVFDAVLFPLLKIVDLPHETAQFIFTIASSLYVLWLARGALQQVILPKIVDDERQQESYQKSGLDEDTAKVLAENVHSAMEENELYLKADLVLADLACAAGITPHILSEVLNKTIGKNFYDFVNGYRVKAAEKLLIETEKPVLQVAFEAGFNNKVSFNQAFKKQVLQTPSQYRKSHAA